MQTGQVEIALFFIGPLARVSLSIKAYLSCIPDILGNFSVVKL